MNELRNKVLWVYLNTMYMDANDRGQTAFLLEDMEDGDLAAHSDSADMMIQDKTITAEDLHDNWCQTKRDEGWDYGPEFDRFIKTHPQMVAFDELPPDIQLREMLAVEEVRKLRERDWEFSDQQWFDIQHRIAEKNMQLQVRTWEVLTPHEPHAHDHELSGYLLNFSFRSEQMIRDGELSEEQLRNVHNYLTVIKEEFEKNSMEAAASKKKVRH